MTGDKKFSKFIASKNRIARAKINSSGDEYDVIESKVDPLERIADALEKLCEGESVSQRGEQSEEIYGPGQPKMPQFKEKLAEETEEKWKKDIAELSKLHSKQLQ